MKDPKHHARGNDERSTEAGGHIRMIANTLAFAVVVIGLSYWGWSSLHAPRVAPGVSAPVAGPPPPRYEQSEAGTRVAHLDVERLRSWCRSAGLPDPPEIQTAEPAVADALINAMGAAAATRAPQAFGRVGRICEALDCFRNAEEYLLRAVRGDPRSFQWPYLLGCVYQETGRREQAIRAFSEALRLNPDYPVAHARLGQLYLEGDRLADAEQHLKRYMALEPKDWLGHIGLGRLALRRKQLDVGLQHLQRAVELGPNDFQAHYYLGKVYAARGETSPAKEQFDLAARLPRGAWFRTRDPLLQEADDLIGGVSSLVQQFERLQDSGDWVAMAELAERIVERRPDDATMMGNLASIYRKLKRFDAAHEMLDRAVALQPDSARLRGLRAAVHFSAGDYRTAAAIARQTIELDPGSALAFNVLARALYMMGRLSEAEPAMRRAVELDPDNAGKVFVLGEMLRADGHAAEAAECYERTLDLDPNHALARENLAALKQSQEN